MHAVIAHDLDEKIRTKDVIIEENVNFTSLLLPTNILKGLTECGFRKPSPIQFKAIPLGRCGFDLIIKSKSGTGKTLVFSTIALESVNTAKNQLQVLILVPTREIAVQIQDVLRNIGRFIEGLKVESFIGGLPLEDDVKKSKLCHIAVGAPGRVKHLITMKALSTEFVRLFVLDEADKLMETSFQNDINEIYNTLPQRKQLIASSATYPQELDTFLSNYMLSPTHVNSELETPILLGLKQFVSLIKTQNPNVAQVMKLKNETLVEIFTKISFTQCLVFSNYQTRAESVSNYLNQKGWTSSFISAAQSQSKRLEAVKNLKDFKSRILLSTDLTSRGIDAPNVDLVINYDMAKDAVTYLHRMGRAGRYGTAGICINLTLEGDELRQLQNILGAIGAHSVSLLPLLDKNFDLWHLDSKDFEQIPSVVSPENSKINEEIKNEVMALKKVNFNNNNQNKKKKKKKEIDSNCVEEVLKSKEKEVDEVCTKLSGVDTDTLFQSLIEEPKVENLLSHLEVDDGKKRKRVAGNESIKELHQEKRTKEGIFYKNKALLNVSKLLSDSNLQISEDLVNSIDEYLKILKEEEMEDFRSSNIEDILGGKIDKEVEKNSEEIVEDIFQIGYKCAIGKDNFTDFLPKEELEQFQDFLKQELVTSSDSEEEEEEEYEEEDYAMEEDNYEEVHPVDDATNNQAGWVPVVSTDDASVARIDYYTKCYENCSNTLWQNGLTFETVENFDNWYYQWLGQLNSVRTYVQQNIYVEEMSKYQQSRFSNS